MMALHDVSLLVLSVAVMVWYVTYCTTAGHGIVWDVEEKEEEREENRK